MAYEPKRVQLINIKCPKCKASFLIRPTEKLCPVCGSPLSKLKKP